MMYVYTLYLQSLEVRGVCLVSCDSLFSGLKGSTECIHVWFNIKIFLSLIFWIYNSISAFTITAANSNIDKIIQYYSVPHPWNNFYILTIIFDIF